MAHLLSDLANFLNLEETNIDNWTFKLYYKVSMVNCFIVNLWFDCYCKVIPRKYEFMYTNTRDIFMEDHILIWNVVFHENISNTIEVK